MASRHAHLPPVRDGLWEVRWTLNSRREARVMLGFHEGMLVALHVFIKKTQKTPRREIDIALQRAQEVQDQ